MIRLLFFILLLFPCQALGWGTLIVGSNVNDGECTTPQDGDEINEGFLGTGFEESGWSETEAANSTVDTDYTLTGTPLDGSCSEGLYVDKYITDSQSYAQWDNGSNFTYPVDVYAELKVVSWTLPGSYDLIGIIAVGPNTDPDSSETAKLTVHKKNDSNIYFRLLGDSDSSYVQFTTDTWYTIMIHLDSTAASSYFTVDGGSQNSFTRETYSVRYISLGATNSTNTDETVEIEVGRVWVDTP